MRHIITFEAHNKPGVLYKVTGLCMQWRINIERLVAREIDRNNHLSKVSLEVSCDRSKAEKLKTRVAHILEIQKVALRKASV